MTPGRSLGLEPSTRKGELLTARWLDIDLSPQTWRIPDTKSNKSHLLPLPAPVITILESLPSRDKSGWVFPSDSSTGHVTNPAKAWKRIRNRAGVPDVRIHDLRRTLGSWMVAQWFNLPLVGRTLNNIQVSNTARYAHSRWTG